MERGWSQSVHAITNEAPEQPWATYTMRPTPATLSENASLPIVQTKLRVPLPWEEKRSKGKPPAHRQRWAGTIQRPWPDRTCSIELPEPGRGYRSAARLSQRTLCRRSRGITRNCRGGPGLSVTCPKNPSRYNTAAPSKKDAASRGDSRPVSNPSPCRHRETTVTTPIRRRMTASQ